MKAALLSGGSISSKWTFEAMKKHFDEVDDLRIKKIEVVMAGKSLEVLYEGKPLPHYDCIYAKGSFRYASVLRTLTSVLYGETYFPLTPVSFSLGHDKLLTHLELQRHKIHMPKTYVASTDSAKAILDKVSYPIVMKFPSGTQGKGVMFADSFSSASSMLDALVALKQPFIIQEYIETSGVDIRAIVVGDKVVACMKRKAVEKEKRANIHAGGKGEPYFASPEVRKLAVDTAKAIGAEICAVDILESPKGALVIEVNLSPGLQEITTATKTDVASKIAKYLYDRTDEFLSSTKKTGAAKIMQELGIEKDEENPLITTLDMRSGRILLSKILTDKTGFDDKSDVVIKAEKNRLLIEKFK
ncbi:RimK family alpha-L-glutamate ligase [Candidatus Woesearchaeota archaeon]|nr:RimK family alpha-L-glutamate ligase [Candidatus Woesearchaeota archaeon]